jgi:hypothetical protein
MLHSIHPSCFERPGCIFGGNEQYGIHGGLAQARRPQGKASIPSDQRAGPTKRPIVAIEFHLIAASYSDPGLIRRISYTRPCRILSAAESGLSRWPSGRTFAARHHGNVRRSRFDDGLGSGLDKTILHELGVGLVSLLDIVLVLDCSHSTFVFNIDFNYSGSAGYGRDYR